MSLNSYGGTFIGFRAMTQQSIKKPEEKKETAPEKTSPDDVPGKVIIELSSAEKIMVPKMDEKGKLELIVTALFDDDSIEEVFKHLRHSTRPVEAKYLFDSYTCDFENQKIVLPCTNRKHVMLYLSCVTSLFDEKNNRSVELRGCGYTKPIMLDKCQRMPPRKEHLSSVEEGKELQLRLAYNVTVTTEDAGPEIPEDREGGLAEFYAAETAA